MFLSPFSFKNIPKDDDWDNASFDWNPCTAFNKGSGCNDALVRTILSLFGISRLQLLERVHDAIGPFKTSDVIKIKFVKLWESPGYSENLTELNV